MKPSGFAAAAPRLWASRAPRPLGVVRKIAGCDFSDSLSVLLTASHVPRIFQGILPGTVDRGIRPAVAASSVRPYPTFASASGAGSDEST